MIMEKELWRRNLKGWNSVYCNDEYGYIWIDEFDAERYNVHKIVEIKQQPNAHVKISGCKNVTGK